MLKFRYGRQQAPYVSGVRIFALVFIFFGLAMNIQTHGWIAWYRMIQSGRFSRAEVIKLQPENHGGCIFQYVVDTKIFKASDTQCNATVGQFIEVRYLPSDPSFATLKNPLSELMLQIGGAAFLSIVAGCQTALQKKRKLNHASKQA